MFLSVDKQGCAVVVSHFLFKNPAHTHIYPLSLHDALPISTTRNRSARPGWAFRRYSPPTSRSGGSWSREMGRTSARSEEHTSELQSLRHLVCRLLLEKKKTNMWTETRWNTSISSRALIQTS